ncbi:MAG: phosphotransferase [Alphaproteobacteria bacterium]|nr:phosphotransferase [Alphaproteobacteria bacterium]
MSDFETALQRLAAKLGGAAENAVQLSGGASQETWSFDVAGEGYILRRAPGGVVRESVNSIGLEKEAEVIRAAHKAGAPAPDVVIECEDGDGLFPGYVMRRLAGETIARKILRDAAFAEARGKLARQCGAALARIHTIEGVALPSVDAGEQLARYEEVYRSFETDRPIFELAIQELKKRTPAPIALKTLHGDFRLGNLMIDAGGLVAALDWELAHVGDPAEDMGWICTPSWRFSAFMNPVGGFGEVEDMLAGYHEAGGDPAVNEARVRFWTMLGSLKWGIMCLTMYRAYETGMDASVERAAIGRRASECELDLVLMMQGKL